MAESANFGKTTFIKNLFEKFSKKQLLLAIAAHPPGAKKNGQPQQPFDQKKQKARYSKAAYPIVPVLFFHVQSLF